MKNETTELIRKLSDISKQSTTVIETLTYKNGVATESTYRLNHYNKYATFSENLKRNYVYNSETELVKEIESRIFNFRK